MLRDVMMIGIDSGFVGLAERWTGGDGNNVAKNH